jgi:hypothetical protein
MAYADSFWILGVGILISLLTLLILRKPGPGIAVAVASRSIQLLPDLLGHRLASDGTTRKVPATER